MPTKTLNLILAAIILSFGFAAKTQSNCHDDATCEDVEENVVGDYYWRDADTTVSYYINDDHPTAPSLTADVKAAAELWSDVSFDGQTIDFEFEYEDTTTLTPGYKDGKNVVGWD